MKNQGGFTLIETLLYIALFTIIIGGGIVAVYQIIQSTDASYSHIILQEEANFLFRKIDWALTGINGPSGIVVPTDYSDTDLIIVKGATQLNFSMDNNNLVLNGTPLNSEGILVSLPPSPAHLFERITAARKPDAIVVSFTLETSQNNWPAEQNFSFTKYLRK